LCDQLKPRNMLCFFRPSEVLRPPTIAGRQTRATPSP
jgi:hypothetical protein